jgi:sporulation protein YabP
MENHLVNMTDRKRLEINCVIQLLSYDEDEVKLQLEEGGALIKGSNLKVDELDLVQGTAKIQGRIDEFRYIKLRRKVRKWAP